MPDATEKKVPVSAADPDPLKKLDAAVIAPRPMRRYRAAAFQVYVWMASGVFVALAVIAHTVAYFPIDLTITHAVQAYHGIVFDRLMFDISWIGFFPQVLVLGVIAVATMFAFGLRWEAVSATFATISIGIGSLVKIVVFRPRPSANLVHVLAQLPSSGFPSGHVLMTTSFGGFLIFLAFTLLKPSLARTALLVLLSLLVALMGVSRIYLGQHWFSDVMGAYLFGSLWLALTIRFYRWGKVRWFVHQPVAPAAPPASKVGTA